MIVRERPHALSLLFILRGSVVGAITPRLLAVLAISLGACWVHQLRPDLFREPTWAPFSLLGLALSIFLGFRNSASYERWWEGRRQWGALIAEIRAFARDAVCLLEPPAREPVARRLVAFAHALKDQLRGEDKGGWRDWISPEEQARTAAARNRPDVVLLAQAAQLAGLLRAGRLGDIEFSLLSNRLAAMTAAQAACERIRSTPAPFTYVLLLHRTAWLFCLLLPFGLAGVLGWATPLAAVILAYAFFGLDALGEELEEPFGVRPNALPLEALVRTIEVAVLEACGEPDLPPALAPKDHILL